jgi:TRAP-type mannitol/chloroaromatic compound transport system substrate-binding protein
MFSRKKVFVLLISVIAITTLLMVGATSALAADKIVWKSSGHGPATDPSQIFHDKLCEAITKASGGRLTIKAFVGGSVVPATKEIDAVDQGVLQMCYTCPMYNLDKWKAAGLISSRPGGLPGEALRTWFNYGGGAELMNKMMEGYNVITFPGAEILANMGAAVVFLPGGELYEAMQRGTIDAFEYSTLASNWVMHFNEIADYVILSPCRAPSDPQCFFVNKQAWEKLPDDLKQLVQDEIDKWTQAQHEYLVYQSIEALQKFKDYGCEVYKLPEEVEIAISNEAEKFYKEKAAKESPIYGEILESMNSYGNAYSIAQ